MSSWIWWLTLGLLLGWMIEWVIDWVYWRGRGQATLADLATARTNESRLRAELDRTAGVAQTSQSELVSLRESLAASRTEGERLQAALKASSDSVRQSTVDLDAAETRVAALRAENDQLRAELNESQGVAGQYQVELGALQTQASKLRAENERLRAELDAGPIRAIATPVTLDAEQAEVYQDQDSLSALQVKPGSEQSKQTLLLDASQLSGRAPAATLGVQQAEDETGRTRVVGADVSHPFAEPANLPGAPASMQEQRRDPLIDINGIGPVYERRLFDAGIYTFAELARLAPERVREIVKAERWQEIAPEEWIAEARLRAEQSRSESS